MQSALDEFYIWGPLESQNNFDSHLWSHYHVATKFGRIRWKKTAKCLVCKEEVGWSGCTGNLRKHISRHHPEIINPNQVLTDRICRLSSSPLDKYEEILNCLVTSWCSTHKDVKNIWIWGGEQYRKHSIWKFFSIKSISKRYVRCEVCNREVYWNQRGLEKLKRHHEKVHVHASEQRRKDTLLRFVFRFGKDEFLKLTDKE